MGLAQFAHFTQSARHNSKDSHTMGKPKSTRHSSLFFTPCTERTRERKLIQREYLADEQTSVHNLLKMEQDHHNDRIHADTTTIVKTLRKQAPPPGLDAFLLEYDLSTHEGIILMCIAEALLRIPDPATIDKLIRDKLSSGNWNKHIEHSESLLVNASTWGLLLTGKIVHLNQEGTSISNWLQRIVAKSGEPIIRSAMKQAMAILGSQFVMGQTINAALKRSQQKASQHIFYSFDMLGEAAMTAKDANDFFSAYKHAIEQLANHSKQKDLYAKDSISVKLSALHPRYQLSQQSRVHTELRSRLFELALLAKKHQLCITIDAEESERLELSLDLFESVYMDPKLDGWSGLGLAVQAYQKRAHAVINWLIHLSKQKGKRIPIRLVKGAYWDSEIKRSQELGLMGYPVFTRKHHTDLSYLVCARTLLAHQKYIYPQFATHNAYTIAYILNHANDSASFEFQRLHGMGETLYQTVIEHFKDRTVHCRVYAPVGGHKELLPYLVRRLLENGANTSFINRIQDKNIPISRVVRNPIEQTHRYKASPHPNIPLPRQLFSPARVNSTGYNLHDENVLTEFAMHFKQLDQKKWDAQAIVGNAHINKNPTQTQVIHAPYDRNKIIGQVSFSDKNDIELAISTASLAQREWGRTAVTHRCTLLNRYADLLEKEFQHCVSLLILEAGKTLSDAVAETREAIDFCRYYAHQAKLSLAKPQTLRGPTGERNLLSLSGRGPFLCISPWNFPLAIFSGQISAALICGNSVLAKPARQTPLIAAFAIDLAHQAGIPRTVLQFLPGEGHIIGEALIRDERIKGVAFTGSTETAHTIHKIIAGRNGGIIPFIAETGGQNTMIVDSSALLEQVVSDVINSAFNSAGQRCSALRVLYLQEDIADKVINLLKGATAELRVGDPRFYATDIGPVIDDNARKKLLAHISLMQQQAKPIFSLPLPASCHTGCYVPPCAFEINHINELKEEVFGPILHIIRYRANDLNVVISDINNTGYGLTLGIHSRIESTVEKIIAQTHIGNIYVNRNMVGAVVGVQPFGGEGLSGTGPKAGGPYYLQRFCSEHTVTINTTAIGGNASLLALDDEP